MNISETTFLKMNTLNALNQSSFSIGVAILDILCETSKKGDYFIEGFPWGYEIYKEQIEKL